MTVEEIEKQFNQLQQEVKDIKEEIEADAHIEFINSLKKYVNKYSDTKFRYPLLLYHIFQAISIFFCRLTKFF